MKLIFTFTLLLDTSLEHFCIKVLTYVGKLNLKKNEPQILFIYKSCLTLPLVDFTLMRDHPSIE